MQVQSQLRKLRDACKPLVADTVFALFVGLFIALLLGSLTLAGVITLKGAIAVLVATWFVGVASTFFIDHIWKITGKHRVVVAALLTLVLGPIGFIEFRYRPLLPEGAAATPAQVVLPPASNESAATNSQVSMTPLPSFDPPAPSTGEIAAQSWASFLNPSGGTMVTTGPNVDIRMDHVKMSGWQTGILVPASGHSSVNLTNSDLSGTGTGVQASDPSPPAAEKPRASISKHRKSGHHPVPKQPKQLIKK